MTVGRFTVCRSHKGSRSMTTSFAFGRDARGSDIMDDRIRARLCRDQSTVREKDGSIHITVTNVPVAHPESQGQVSQYDSLHGSRPHGSVDSIQSLGQSRFLSQQLAEPHFDRLAVGFVSVQDSFQKE